MKKKSSSPKPSGNLPVSKQTAGGVAGAILGGVIGGPVGAVAGAIAGTMMGNRAAEGKTLVSSTTVKTAKDAVQAVKQKLPSSTRRATARPVAAKPKAAKSAPSKPVAAKKSPPKAAVKAKTTTQQK